MRNATVEVNRDRSLKKETDEVKGQEMEKRECEVKGKDIEERDG